MLNTLSKQLLPPSLRERIVAARSAAALRRSPALARLADGDRFPARSDDEHIIEILGWFDWALTETGGQGFPQLVNLRALAETGKVSLGAPYPETTGYTLCSMAMGHRTGRPTLPPERLAIVAGYLLAEQLPSGGFPGPGDMTGKPLAFDTGQILKGLVAYHRHVQADDAVHAAIVRAGDWLAAQIEADGSYGEASCYRGKRCYYVEASVGLMQAGLMLQRVDWLEAARRNAQWALSQRRGEVWFDRFSFEDDAFQNLHGIAYTLRGLIDLGRGLDEPGFIDAALPGLERMTARDYPDLPAPDAVPGHFADGFQRWRRTISPTGMAQTALCLYLAAELRNEPAYRARAERLTNTLKGLQLTGFAEPALNGTLSGSWPVTGPYMHCALPHWAAKYFLDCLYVSSGVNPLLLEG